MDNSIAKAEQPKINDLTEIDKIIELLNMQLSNHRVLTEKACDIAKKAKVLAPLTLDRVEVEQIEARNYTIFDNLNSLLYSYEKTNLYLRHYLEHLESVI